MSAVSITRSTAMKKFAKELQAAIDTGVTSVAKLSQDTGLSRMHLYRLMRGEMAPSLDTAEKIAKRIGLKIEITRC